MLDYRTIFHSATDAMVVSDAQTVVVEANAAACEMFGYSHDELLGLPVRDLVHPDEQAQMREAMKAIASGEAVVRQRRILRKDGTSLTVELSGRALPDGHRLAILRDVSERLEREAKVRENEAWLRLVVEQIPAVMWTTDLHLRFTSSLGAGLRQLGVNPQEVRGMSVPEFFQTENQGFIVIRAHRQALQGEPISYQVEWLGRTYATHIDALRDHQGQIIGTVGVAYDFSEQVKAERDLQRAKADLENRVVERTRDLSHANAELRREVAQHERTAASLREQQKLLRELLELHERDRRVLAYEIHDGLVQYITGALLRLEALVHRQGVSGEGADDLDVIMQLMRDTVAEARRIITGLRPPVLDEAGLVAAIEFLVQEQRQRAGIDIEFVHHLVSSRLATPVETALFRAAQEGLTNVRRHSRSSRARVELAQENDTIRLVVQDWGNGFEPEKARQQAYGLMGIRERARLLGGTAEVRSAPGRGTIVEVRYPLLAVFPEAEGA